MQMIFLVSYVFLVNLGYFPFLLTAHELCFHSCFHCGFILVEAAPLIVVIPAHVHVSARFEL